MYSTRQHELIISPSLRWLVINPLFLCLEILVINYILITNFSLHGISFLGGFVFIIFSIFYFFLDFSQITPVQSFLLLFTGIFEIFASLLTYNIGRHSLMIALLISQILVGLRYYHRTKIIVKIDKS